MTVHRRYHYASSEIRILGRSHINSLSDCHDNLNITGMRKQTENVSYWSFISKFEIFSEYENMEFGTPSLESFHFKGRL